MSMTVDDTAQTPLADDVIAGAEAIALFLGMTPRQVYAHAERGNLPVFRIGATICLRRSTMIGWIGSQESQPKKPVPSSDAPEGPVPITVFRGRNGRVRRR